MTFLLDQNLSPRLTSLPADLFPNSVHVRDVGLQRADDLTVWSHARTHGLVIVSKDADFRQMSFLLGHPPKVVLVRLGNCSTAEIANLICTNTDAIGAFVQDEEAGFLALG